MDNMQNAVKNVSAKRGWLALLVSTYRGNRNKARWWRQEFKRRRSWRGFQGWMIRRNGDYEYGCGARSWHVNGTLCSLWCAASRLKIYYYADGKYSHTDHFELGDKLDNKRAREAVKLLSANIEEADGVRHDRS